MSTGLRNQLEHVSDTPVERTNELENLKTYYFELAANFFEQEHSFASMLLKTIIQDSGE